MIEKKFISLQLKLFLFSILLVLIPLLILGSISYVVSVSIIKEKVSLSNLKTVEQTGNNIEFLFNDLFTTSIFLLQSDEIRSLLKTPIDHPQSEIEKTKLTAQRYLAYLTATKDYSYSFYIEGYNHVILDTMKARFQLSPKLKEKAESLNGSSLWTIEPIIDYNGVSKRVFSIIRQIKDINNLSNPLGILKLNMDESLISALYSKTESNLESTYYIINAQGVIVSALDKALIGNPLSVFSKNQDYFTKKSGFYEFQSQGESHLMTYYPIEDTDWILVNIVPFENLLTDIQLISKTTFISIFIGFIICIFFAYSFSKRILAPLKRLSGHMEELENGNYDIRMVPPGNDEITLLAESFNKMANNLSEVRNQVYLSTIKQKEAELIALQTQINPHFLYNTLDTIYWSARIEKAFKSASLVQALSHLFRLSLNSGNQFTTVEKEIKHLNHYLTIQEARYKDLITFQITADPATYPCKVIKLVLQPLVENAIYHGIEKKNGSGHIHVRTYLQDNKLIYDIEDNGVGADVVSLNALLQDKSDDKLGFAIKNVNDRIQLYSGQAYGLSFFNSDSGGITARVTQSLIKS